MKTWFLSDAFPPHDPNVAFARAIHENPFTVTCLPDGEPHEFFCLSWKDPLMPERLRHEESGTVRNP